MILTGEYVRFNLSPEGRVALKDLFPEGGSFSAFVVQRDELGFWVWLRGRGSSAAFPPPAGDWVPVHLLKPEYISTAVLDIEADVIAGAAS
jgi:hypothetical protein